MTIRLIDQGDFIEVIGEIYRLNGNIWMASSRVYKEKIGKFKSGEIKDNPIDISKSVVIQALRDNRRRTLSSKIEIFLKNIKKP